jgi:hypothetical protein
VPPTPTYTGDVRGWQPDEEGMATLYGLGLATALGTYFLIDEDPFGLGEMSAARQTEAEDWTELGGLLQHHAWPVDYVHIFVKKIGILCHSQCTKCVLFGRRPVRISGSVAPPCEPAPLYTPPGFTESNPVVSNKAQLLRFKRHQRSEVALSQHLSLLSLN